MKFEKKLEVVVKIIRNLTCTPGGINMSGNAHKDYIFCGKCPFYEKTCTGNPEESVKVAHQWVTKQHEKFAKLNKEFPF